MKLTPGEKQNNTNKQKQKPKNNKTHTKLNPVQ